MSITPEQRREWRESAEWHDDGHLDCDERILALLDALEEAERERDDLRIVLDDHPSHRMGCDWCHRNEAALARVKALAEKWIACPDDPEDQVFVDCRVWHGHVLRNQLRRAALAGPAEERGDEA